MDEKTSRHFAEIIELAQTVFKNVTYEIDATPDQSILRINAEYVWQISDSGHRVVQ